MPDRPIKLTITSQTQFAQAAYLQGIHQCLEAILSPDTNQIKAATTELNTKYYKSAECIPALYESAASSPNDGVSENGVRLAKEL